MGNGNSNFIFLKMNSQNFSAKSYLKGEVLIKIVDKIPSNPLDLILTGRETIEFGLNSDNRKFSNTFLDYKINLHEFRTPKINYGDYVFPFEIFLPKDLPSSSVIITDDFTSSIEYILQAKTSENFETSIPITIKSYQKFESVQNRSDCLVEIKSCYCIKRTEIDLIVKTNKSAYMSNEIIKLSIEGICKLLPRVRVNVFRSILLDSGQGQTLMSKTSIFEIITKENNLDIDLLGLSQRIGNCVSTKGTLFKCSYSISVVGITDNICGAEEIELTLWIVVNLCNAPQPFQISSIPWKPIYMNRIQYHAGD